MVLEVSEDYFTETEEKDVKQRTGTVNCMIVTLILCIIAELILRFARYIKAKILLREPTREIMRVTIMRRSTKCVL